MSWVDTGISLHRSSAHHGTWVANLPGTEVHNMIDHAGPLRVVQKDVLDTEGQYIEDSVGSGYDRVRWQRDGLDTWRLEVRCVE